MQAGPYRLGSRNTGPCDFVSLGKSFPWSTSYPAVFGASTWPPNHLKVNLIPLGYQQTGYLGILFYIGNHNSGFG